MDWDKLRVFHAVAEAGSFTHAGESLGLSQSAISRQVSALEDSLQVPLFHRHARGLILTEQGETLFKTVHDVFAKLAMTEALLTERRDHPSGPLKVTTTLSFGTIWLAPRLKLFNERYPDVSIKLVLADAELDLAMRQADVAIRMRPPRQPDLIQRNLMTMRYFVYGSRDYLQRYGTPRSPEDLDQHNIVVYGDSTPAPVDNIDWLISEGTSGGRKRRAVLEVNSVYGIFRAVQAGLGLGALPHYLANEQGDMVQVMPELRGPTFDAYFVYPEELRHSKRIAVFRDFLIEQIAQSHLN